MGFHCDKCAEVAPPLRLHPMKAPAKYTFNHEVLEPKDASGEPYGCVPFVCGRNQGFGTTSSTQRRVSGDGSTTIPSRQKRNQNWYQNLRVDPSRRVVGFPTILFG